MFWNRHFFSKMILLTASSLIISGTCFADDVKKPNLDALNTEITDETLVIGLASEPSGLWGSGTGKVENEMLMIDMALTDTLVSMDPETFELKPCLATEWEWQDDTHCRFVLRDDVTMTDGSLLEAEDVVYSVNTWMECSANTDTGKFLQEVTAEDDHTVTIGFNTSAPDMLKMLSWSNFGIVSEDEINALGGIENADKNPVFGSGRYRFKEWERGQYITLERNDSYWDPDYKGYFKTIKFNFTPDASARILAVQSGDAQIAYQVPVNMGAAHLGNGAVSVYAYPVGANLKIWYNMGPKAGATADIKVRQAIDKALDFEAIAAVGTAGMAKEVRSYFPENSAFSQDVLFSDEERAVDIEGAKELLAEAGYGEGLSLRFVGLSEQESVFTVIQENLRQIGIDLSLSIVDVPTYLEMANGGDYDLIYVSDQIDLRYPSCFSFFRQASIDTFCVGGAKWTTPELEEAINAFVEERDEEKAKEEAYAIEETLKSEMPFSSTCPQLNCVITGSDIKGIVSAQLGYINPTTIYK